MPSNKNNNFRLYMTLIMSAITIGLVAAIIMFGYTSIFSLIGNGNNSAKNQHLQTQVVSLKQTNTNQVTQAYDKVKDSLVTVENYQFYDGSMEISNQGTGVVYKIDKKYAYILSSYHVLDGSSVQKIIDSKGNVATATVVSVDKEHDLVILKAPKKAIKTTIEFADSSKVKIGQPVLALGSPLGTNYSNTITRGIVSATNRNIQADYISVDAIQTDASINPGNAGGPLINLEGKLVGINSMKISESNVVGVTVEGMGFAIPSNTVKEFALNNTK